MRDFNNNIDNDLILWQQTHDDELFKDKLVPVLANFSAAIISQYYGRDATKTEIDTLITDIWQDLLKHPYDPKKSNKPSGYLWQRMQFKFTNSIRTQTSRNKRLTSLDAPTNSSAVNHCEDETGGEGDLLSTMAAPEPPDDSDDDKIEVSGFYDYLHNRIGKDRDRGGMADCLRILDFCSISHNIERGTYVTNKSALLNALYKEMNWQKKKYDYVRHTMQRAMTEYKKSKEKVKKGMLLK